ncbi:unnamed protein product [Prunus armeniaca]
MVDLKTRGKGGRMGGWWFDALHAEVSLNAQALKKFVEENQRLASECNKWERERALSTIMTGRL